MKHRNQAFNGAGKRASFDPSPNALTRAEVLEAEDRILAGQAPRMWLIRKMLRLAPKVVCQPTQGSFAPPLCRTCGCNPCLRTHAQ